MARRPGDLFRLILSARRLPMAALLLTLLTLPVVAGPAGVPAQAAQDDKFAAVMKAGEAALKKGEVEEAIAAFKEANGLKNKASVEAMLALSRAYVMFEAFKSAVQSCDDALKVAGADKRLEAAIRNQKGMALVAWAEKPGDPKLKDAEAEFRKVIEMGDTFVLAPYNLGVTLLKLNRDEEGIAQLKVYLERAGRAPEADLARKMIENPRRAREFYAPDFSVVTSEGEFISLKDLAGKTVLLDFWGTWCPPCRAATPDLVTFYRTFSKKENFVMIGVAVGEASEQGWRDYITQNKMGWVEYLDKSRKVASAFNVRSYPTYVVINGEGIVQGTKSGWGGAITLGWIVETVNKSLKAAAPKPPGQ